MLSIDVIGTNRSEKFCVFGNCIPRPLDGLPFPQNSLLFKKFSFFSFFQLGIAYCWSCQSQYYFSCTFDSKWLQLLPSLQVTVILHLPPMDFELQFSLFYMQLISIWELKFFGVKFDLNFKAVTVDPSGVSSVSKTQNLKYDYFLLLFFFLSW